MPMSESIPAGVRPGFRAPQQTKRITPKNVKNGRAIGGRRDVVSPLIIGPHVKLGFLEGEAYEEAIYLKNR